MSNFDKLIALNERGKLSPVGRVVFGALMGEHDAIAELEALAFAAHGIDADMRAAFLINVTEAEKANAGKPPFYLVMIGAKLRKVPRGETVNTPHIIIDETDRKFYNDDQTIKARFDNVPTYGE